MNAESQLHNADSFHRPGGKARSRSPELPEYAIRPAHPHALAQVGGQRFQTCADYDFQVFASSGHERPPIETGRGGRSIAARFYS